ncbi:hypothetical protein AOLI_G00282240 [Acnodon oligacanthus]
MSASDVHPHLSEDYCMYRGRRLGGAYFCSSLSVFVGGLVILLLCKFGSRAIRRLRVLPKHNRTHPQDVDPDAVLSLRNSLRMWAFSIISAQRRPGKILTLLTFCVHLCSVVTYMIMTAYPVEHCMQDYTALFMVDVVFNLFYVVNFGLRFIAAQDKLLAWVELKSLIDFFTIIPSFIGLFTKRAWLGLKFLRALNFLELPRVLQLLNIPHSNTSLKLTRLIAVLVGSLLTAAGALHLLENSGDPWSSPPNIYIRTYFETVYCLVVTMSTVGYGDVVAHTVSGRFFIIVFIITGLGLFASYVPEVFGIIMNRKRFKGSYTNTSGETHVVVCGHITLANASAFMREFLHKDRGDVYIKVLFLGNFHPNQELVDFFSLHFLQASFYEGSVLKRRDLERVMMSKASACLILCDRFTDDQNNEDVANLMRVISIKRYCPDTRVIVQIFKHSSKVYLQNVPNWDWSRGDAVICLAELKLGFMAQSCQVPGLSTLLANLFTMQSEVENEGDSWQNLYRQGLCNEMYTEYLSSAFNSMSFSQASKFCFLKLKLLLIGIEYQSGDDDLSVLVNPPSNIMIKNRTLGFFIASNAAHAKRASFYCFMCHSDIKDLTKMRPCTCTSWKDVPYRNFSSVSVGCRRPSFGVMPCSFSDRLCELLTENQLQQNVGQVEEEEVKLDSTGLFHWCTPVPLQDITLTRQAAPVVSAESSLTSLELKTVVFLADPLYFIREWPSIHYFPNVYFLPGSPLCGADLKALSVERCVMCVVLNAFSCVREHEPAMQDKETILSCVNLYSILFSQELNLKHTRSPGHRDFAPTSGPSCLPQTGATVPLLVELENTSNVQYISNMDGAEMFSRLSLTQAFAEGSVFSMDFLDSLAAATYFNARVPALICTLVTGGDTPVLEAQLAENDHLDEGNMSPQLRALRQRSKLVQLALDEKPLTHFKCNHFKDLFCQALENLEIMCFGLYRLLDPTNASLKRYVITNPPADLPLLPTDKVFCSVPFHQSYLLIRTEAASSPQL